MNLRLMSTAFLECETFFKEFPEMGESYRCCKGLCHAEPRNRIYVRPWRDSEMGAVGNTDWSLCVEGIVCCGIYEFVRGIPREWWIAKGKELGVGRGDGRGYLYPSSPHRNTEHPTSSRGPAAKTANTRRAAGDPDDGLRSGGLAAFLRRR